MNNWLNTKRKNIYIIYWKLHIYQKAAKQPTEKKNKTKNPKTYNMSATNLNVLIYLFP